MKNKFMFQSAVAAALIVSIVAFSPVSATEKVKKSSVKPAVQTVKIDVDASRVEWIGKKVTGQHNGVLKLKNGEITVNGDQPVSGNISMDMATLDDKDLSGDMHDKLVGHLKSPDFFNVEKFPTSDFKILGSTPIAGATQGQPNYTINGELTIKGITQPLSFPASVIVTGQKVEAKATNIEVDRTLYDIRYGSGKFFEGLGDKVISDKFLITLMIVANK